MLKISVIVPVYNVEPYIRRCLDSLTVQTYQDLEIILVDDGSTDRSGEICDEYAESDNRIRVIHQTNQGIVSARQAGIRCATGEYATNVDSDDWIEKGAYDFMAQKLQEYHPDMLVLGYKKEYAGFTEEYRQVLGEGFYLREQFWEEFNQCIDSKDFFCQPIDMSLWNKAIRTDLFKKHQLNCSCLLKKNVDDAVIFPCLLDISSIYVESRCFYHYCVRKESILWQNQKADFELYIRLVEHYITSYRNNGQNLMSNKFLLYKLFYHLILDVPQKLIADNECGIYPQLRKDSRIIIYGKGVFANRLIDKMHEQKFADIVEHIDKTDMKKLYHLDNEKYDYILIAILNCVFVESTARFLMESGIKRDKILCIEKENLTEERLPDEVRTIWEAV